MLCQCKITNALDALNLNAAAKAPIPSDVSMRGLPYMPLYGSRLLRSKAWAKCSKNPELGFYLINLWLAAWDGLPAGSIEYDDDVLRTAAQCPPAVWEKLCRELLRGWIRCADGRLYNQTVCDAAAAVWESRTEKREALTKARLAKAEKRNRRHPPGQTVLPLPPVIAARSEPAPAAGEAWPGTGPEPFTSGISLQSVSTLPDNPLERPETDGEPLSVTGVKLQVTSEKEEKGEEPPLTPRQKNRGSRLPDNFDPGAEGHLFAQRCGLDSDETAAAFCDHYRQAVGLRAMSADWPAAFREWCRRGQAMQRRGAPFEWKEKPGEFDWMRDMTFEKMVGLVGVEKATAMDEWAYGKRAA